MLWIVLAMMLAAAISILAIPPYLREKRLSASTFIGICIVAIVAPSAYHLLGTPSGAGSQEDGPGTDDMVGSLAARLQEQPDDVAGWKMLGRSYFELERYQESADAFHKAVDLESSGNGQTLADLGQAMLMSDPDSINDRAGQLFESALALSPDNAKALFYGGMSAINRGDALLGADRWERLLATSPPPQNVADLLRARIALLRGEAPPEIMAPPAESAPLLIVRIELGEKAGAAVNGDATVFLIARDPDQPSPPIAAIRRQASELPANLTLSDSDAMIPGRVPSAFSELEIIARVSSSGDPIARSGDWFGAQRIRRETGSDVHIRIDQQIP